MRPESLRVVREGAWVGGVITCPTQGDMTLGGGAPDIGTHVLTGMTLTA